MREIFLSKEEWDTQFRKSVREGTMLGVNEDDKGVYFITKNTKLYREE